MLFPLDRSLQFRLMLSGVRDQLLMGHLRLFLQFLKQQLMAVQTCKGEILEGTYHQLVFLLFIRLLDLFNFTHLRQSRSFSLFFQLLHLQAQFFQLLIDLEKKMMLGIGKAQSDIRTYMLGLFLVLLKIRVHHLFEGLSEMYESQQWMREEPVSWTYPRVAVEVAVLDTVGGSIVDELPKRDGHGPCSYKGVTWHLTYLKPSSSALHHPSPSESAPYMVSQK